jgi:hypothetical protein
MLSSPLFVVVVTVALRSPTGTTVDPEPDLSLPLLKYPLVVGVPLLRGSIVLIDIIDIAEPGRGLGLGLGGCPLSESEVSSEEGEYRPGSALLL